MNNNITEINNFLNTKIEEKSDILKYLNNALLKDFVSESLLVKEINFVNGFQNLNIKNCIGKVTVDE